MKKSYILIILISFLVISPKLYAQVECPCDFESVPKDTECWTEPFDFVQPNYDSFSPPFEECILDNSRDTNGTHRMDFSVFTVKDGSGIACMIKQINIDEPCLVPSVTESELTPEEVLACKCELLAYTTALNEVEGIDVGQGPPYVCGNVDLRSCGPQAIPTLNEYGMIITAGVLGLLAVIGLFVIRRRKVSA